MQSVKRELATRGDTNPVHQDLIDESEKVSYSPNLSKEPVRDVNVSEKSPSVVIVK